jgi:hypothetical protein
VLRPIDQLALFRSKPKLPPWAEFPVEVRAQTVQLLTQLLRQHRHHLLQQPVGREVRDE